MGLDRNLVICPSGSRIDPIQENRTLRRMESRHCERSEAIHSQANGYNGLLRRCAPRNDGCLGSRLRADPYALLHAFDRQRWHDDVAQMGTRTAYARWSKSWMAGGYQPFAELQKVAADKLRGHSGRYPGALPPQAQPTRSAQDKAAIGFVCCGSCSRLSAWAGVKQVSPSLPSAST
jgi:hypothetical protein